MFLKNLSIIGDTGVIRDITFHKGMNLIVDETVRFDGQQNSGSMPSGNSVGKTTVLKLVNFCLGGDYKEVFADPENNKNVDYTVKSFLLDHHVHILLCLKEDLDKDSSNEIIIERNFLTRNKKIAKVNGHNYTNEKEFESALRNLLYPDIQDERPTFSQLIANNIRYKDIRINNTINNLHPSTQQFDYESLYLYMLGCPMDIGKQKLELQDKIKLEKIFLKKLLQNQSKNAYSYTLSSIQNEIDILNKKKEHLNINEHFQNDLDQLNEVKMSIGLTSSAITNNQLKLDHIEKGIVLIEKDNIDISKEELRYLYDDVSANIGELQHTFEQLVRYHETMLTERKELLVSELNHITPLINASRNEMEILLKKESILAIKVKKSDTLEDLDRINSEINMLHQKVGEYTMTISQIEDSESKLDDYNVEIKKLEQSVYSEKAIKRVEKHVKKFDEYFTKFSKELYGEPYHLKHEIKVTKNEQKYYHFDTFSMAISTGKKQGETLSFDLAYIDYAQHENIHHLDFLLNDKKELMDINQIIKVTEILKESNMQLVLSILQDKLPDSLNNDNHVILRLSQMNKLFRIEEINGRDKKII